MTPNVDITPVTIQIKQQNYWKCLSNFSVKKLIIYFFPITNLPNTN